MMKSAALSREADMLRNTVENQKVQIQSLQSLLATREQEHRYVYDSFSKIKV